MKRILLLAFCTAAFAADYPEARKADHIDTYHGVRVPDPYRWLESENSPETAAWVEAQNRVTFAYLDRIPYRKQLKERLERLYNFPRYTTPVHRAGYYTFSKNDGLQNQSVVYIQKGLNGAPEVLLDPNTFSTDGTVRLGILSLSRDGKYAAYGRSTGGSDWQTLSVMEVATRKNLPDKLEWLKASGVAWAGDGFFYSRYDAPAKGQELSSKNEYQKVYFHRIGRPQSDDELIYENKSAPQRFHRVSTTEDQRYALLYVSERGAGKDGNALYFRDLSKGEKTFTPIVSEITDDSFSLVGSAGSKLFIETNRKAPNGRVFVFDAERPDAPWADIIPERPEPLSNAGTAGGKIFVTYSKDVATRAYVHSLDGKLENEIQLPAPGTASGFRGESGDREVFYSFTSLNYPPTIFKYDIASKKSEVFRTPDIPAFNPDQYESKQVFFTSRDGTRVPMFLVHKKGLKLDGNNPTLLYGYGGFNISTNPAFAPLRLGLLEQGFVYASANIRGGSEYGEKWHQEGMKLKKQNVFDDFIAAAEWLIANKYTSPAKLACQGGSNGGLLVGAVINQRPDLFRAAVPQVGVMDMLRFHKFTIGWNWIADYGSSDNAEEFKALYAYSPIHNVRPGVRYPATLITTADHDDRVVPAHSFKYAATMQERAGKQNPVLIRIDTKSGHGASSTTKMIEQQADVQAFLFHELGVTPKF